MSFTVEPMTETSFIILALILLPVVALSLVTSARYWSNQKRFDQYLLLAKELKLAVIGSKEPLLSLIEPINGSHSVSGLYKTYHVSIRYRYMWSFITRGKWPTTCLSLTVPALADINPDKMLHELVNESGTLFKGPLTLENGIFRYEERSDVIDDLARRWMKAKIDRLVVIADKLSARS